MWPVDLEWSSILGVISGLHVPHQPISAFSAVIRFTTIVYSVLCFFMFIRFPTLQKDYKFTIMCVTSLTHSREILMLFVYSLCATFLWLVYRLVIVKSPLYNLPGPPRTSWIAGNPWPPHRFQ